MSSSSSLQEIRTKSQVVFDYIADGSSPYWTYNPDNLPLAAEHVEKLILRDYNGDISIIPPHSRLRHHTINSNEFEREEDLLDMIVLSTILDAGAGDQWKYKSRLPNGEIRIKIRSEGIAQAVEDMYKNGIFGNCNGDDLEKLSFDDMKRGFQISMDNPMNGLEGRMELLHRLGQQLKTCNVFASNRSPSGIIEFIKKQNITKMSQLWDEIVMAGFAPIFPQRDEWFHQGLSMNVHFHKLLQWLSYTLVDLLSAKGINFEQDISLTGLPEYRNGGLFVDCDVIALKQPIPPGSLFKPSDDLVIEWRCATVILIDELHSLLKEKYGDDLKLAQVLEAGTWKAGREMAAEIS